MALRPLEGFSVGITANRRWEEQAQLLERRGATVFHGPSIATMRLTADEGLRRATRDLIERPPEFLMATTGIGMRAWLEYAHAAGMGDALLDSLRTARVLARGPKAAACCEGLGLEVAVRAESERSEELIGRLLSMPLSGVRVAVQGSGEASSPPVAPLIAAGAEVIELASYRWQLPADPGSAKRLIELVGARRVDAVTFTSAPALSNLFDIAGGHADRLREAFNSGVTAACVGPVCAERALALGIHSPVQPGLGRLGLLVRALSEHLAGERLVFRANQCTVVLQRRALAVDGATVALTQQERALLGVLLDRPGVIYSGERLNRRLWHGDATPHAVSVAISRLRRKLGPAGPALISRRGRGYCLQVDR